MGKDTKSLQQADTNLHSRQAEANKAARDYNAKYDPRNRGLQKGLIGLKYTRNVGVSFKKTPPGYTWHHLDDYNVTTNTFTLELVLRWAHRATTPHSGGCAMYKAATGHRYK